MKLNNLTRIHNHIRARNQTYGIFEFSKNNKKFDIFFDISCHPYKLGFLLIRTNFELWLSVYPGYKINERLSEEDYYKLCKALELKPDPDNKFSPFAFFSSFNDNIPTTFINIPRNKKNEILLKVSVDMEEKDRLFYKGLIDWDKNDSKKRKTIQNSEKTRLLYPDLYEFIKNRNISVIYTSLESEENRYVLNF